MKKGLVVVVAAVLMSVAAGGVFAQDKTPNVKKIWVSGEVSVLGAGGRFEFMLGPKLSLGVNGYWNSLFFVFNDVGAVAFMRYYFTNSGIYGGIGVGYSMHSGTETYEGEGYWAGSTTTDFIVASGFGIVPELGWKIDVGKAGGFFLNPVIQVPITLGNKAYVWKPAGFGVGVGFRVALGLGYSFL